MKTIPKHFTDARRNKMKKDTNAKSKTDDKLQAISNEGKQSVSLDSPGVAKALAKRILEDVDEYCVDTYDGGHRWHLGASLIGDECKRKLWYIFRWCKHEKTTGRQQRLFNRGHKEEFRFIEWLEGIGVQVWADDFTNNTLWFHAESDSYILLPNGEDPGDPCCEPVSAEGPYFKKHVERARADGVEFPQYRISAANGHFGGSLDGIARLPERYGIDEPVLLEFKTNGTGKGFTDLKTDGMPVAKPQHFAQTSTYGNEYGFNYVLYLNICKNDDDLHIEIAKLDHKLGEQMKLKAEQIITSDKPPAKLSENATFFKCKFCHFSEICHKGAVPEVNCRSCAFASPAEGGEWFCSKHNGIIPRDFVPKACPEYKAITQNV